MHAINERKFQNHLCNMLSLKRTVTFLARIGLTVFFPRTVGVSAMGGGCKDECKYESDSSDDGCSDEPNDDYTHFVEAFAATSQLKQAHVQK